MLNSKGKSTPPFPWWYNIFWYSEFCVFQGCEIGDCWRHLWAVIDWRTLCLVTIYSRGKRAREPARERRKLRERKGSMYSLLCISLSFQAVTTIHYNLLLLLLYEVFRRLILSCTIGISLPKGFCLHVVHNMLEHIGDMFSTKYVWTCKCSGITRLKTKNKVLLSFNFLPK